MSQPFPLVRVAGSFASMGEQYGRQATPLIERALELYLPSFEERGFGIRDVIALGRRFAERIGEASAGLHDELAGIAHGSGRDLGEIVAINARTELLYGESSQGERDIDGDGCTGAIALPAATRDGHVLHGQNWDWRDSSAEISLVLAAEPEEGPAFLTLVEAGTLARCGVNTAGIAITGNFLKAQAEFSPAGLPAPFVRRRVLSAENMHDALAAVITSPRSFSINVMISDAGGEAFNLETTPEEVFWDRAQRDLIVHANHFATAAARSRVIDLGLAVTPDSLYRDARVRAHLERMHGSLTLADFRDAFADRYGEPFGVCRFPSAGPGGTSASTVATVLMDVNETRLLVAPQPYNGASYWQYTLGGGAPEPVQW
jgi:isopenicillin-N N-acyltransferase-like protein